MDKENVVCICICVHTHTNLIQPFKKGKTCLLRKQIDLKGTVLGEIKTNIHKLTDTENRMEIAKSRGGGVGGKVVRRYKLSVLSSGNVLYTVVTIVSNTVLYI